MHLQQMLSDLDGMHDTVNGGGGLLNVKICVAIILKL